MIYLEHPATVGYSKCIEKNGNCSFNDITDSAYNFKFLKGWLEAFTEYENHTLYLAGESYAGVYVPLLAWRIVVANQARVTQQPVRLAGFLVGNACTNWKYDTFPATVDVAYHRAMYSDDLHDQILAANCNFTGVAFQTIPQPPICDQYMAQINDSLAYVNILNLYQEVPIPATCRNTNQATAWYQPYRQNECTKNLYGDFMTDYFNRNDTRAALHIRSDVELFKVCVGGDNGQNANYTIDANGTQWVYEQIKGQVRMLAYSGDQDGAVPTIGTINWINTLNRTEDKAWAPYFHDDVTPK